MNYLKVILFISLLFLLDMYAQVGLEYAHKIPNKYPCVGEKIELAFSIYVDGDVNDFSKLDTPKAEVESWLAKNNMDCRIYAGSGTTSSNGIVKRYFSIYASFTPDKVEHIKIKGGKEINWFGLKGNLPDMEIFVQQAPESYPMAKIMGNKQQYYQGENITDLMLYATTNEDSWLTITLKDRGDFFTPEFAKITESNGWCSFDYRKVNNYNSNRSDRIYYSSSYNDNVRIITYYNYLLLKSEKVGKLKLPTFSITFDEKSILENVGGNEIVILPLPDGAPDDFSNFVI
ncbi:MAG: hypothetical protein ACRC37_02025, partial [Lentisphaeria bacterium]